MKITSLLRHEFVIEKLKSATKEEALAELSSVLPLNFTHDDRGAVVRVLMERERLGSTGIGDGIAIPHGTIRSLDDLLVSFGRSKAGIEFDAVDGKPVHLFFLLLSPERSSGQHLKVLAKISRMLKDAFFRKRLMEAESHDDLYGLIAEKDDMI